MPNKNKNLGTSLERRVVERAQAKGLHSRRQPLSGVLKEFPNDVEIERLLGECKVRTAHLNAKGAKCITFELGWLTNCLTNAAREGYAMGAVMFAPKSSQDIYAVVTLETLLDLLGQRVLQTGAKLVPKPLDGDG